MFGQVTRDQDKQGHVEDIDESHYTMIDDVHIVQGDNHVSQDDKDNQQSLDRVYSVVSSHCT